MKLNIAVINGDGVGPEMMTSALLILETTCRQFSHELTINKVLAAGEAIDICKNPLPDESLRICKKADAVLFGNSGLEKYQNNSLDQRPEYALMKLRKEVGVTTNIRPIHLYEGLKDLSPLKKEIVDKGFDIVFVRDIVGGVFCSDKVKAEGFDGLEAYEFEYYNEKIILDTAHLAFAFARERRRKLLSLDKANVLESSRLWRKTLAALGEKNKEIDLSHGFIDSAIMDLIANPGEFDVIVTTNLFGDIIADAGTMLTGSAKLYGSAELAKDKCGIYTPNQLHDSDEQIIGRQLVNPIGMISAVALMMRYSFGLSEEAQAIEQAIKNILDKGYVTQDIVLPDKKFLKTNEIAELISNEIMNIQERKGEQCVQ